MQAGKPPGDSSASASPTSSSTTTNSKKCNTGDRNPGPGRGSNKSQQVAPSAASSAPRDAAKSVAQRVMEVTTSSKPSEPPTKANNTDGLDQLEHQEQLERLASRTSKLDSSPGISSASSSSNLVPSHDQQQQIQAKPAGGSLSTSSCSSLLLLPPTSIAGSNSSQSHSSQRAAPLQAQQNPDGPNLARISLETKVPHPLASGAGLFQSRAFKANDEVSYYNDAQLERQKQECQLLLEPKRPGGSLDNTVKPKLLLAASVSSMGSHGHHPPDGYHNDYHQQHPRQPTYEHNYMTADYDDVYEHQQRYDNALVVEQQFQQANGPFHQRGPSSGGYSRYQEIASPPPPPELPQVPHTSSSSPGATQQTSFCRQTVTISTSPKAKSAPATPCNVTPTAFHQNLRHHHPHQGGGGGGSHTAGARDAAHQLMGPNLAANTLPPDIRKNISATCRALPSSAAGSQQAQNAAADLKYLENLIKSGEVALLEKNYNSAIGLFSECISLATTSQNISYLKRNFKIYGQRAEAHYQVANYREAIEDSIRARELNPKWTQAYFLQGRSLLMIGEFARSLAVFSFGLTQEPSSELLFGALVEAALNSRSPFKQDFELKYTKLKAAQLAGRPFLVVSLLGQVLLSRGHSEHAAIILESALKLAGAVDLPPALGDSPPLPAAAAAAAAASASPTATANTTGEPSTQQHKRFRSSVLSTISLAYCTLHDYDKAICYMNKELDIEQELEDVGGQCRVLSNLGLAFYKARKFDKALEAHRRQLNLAMRTHLFPQASQALTAIGHVHVAKCDYSNALTSHTRCLDILRQLGNDCYSQFREMLAIGHMHAMLADYETAEEKFREADQLLKQSRAAGEQLAGGEFARRSIMVQFDLAHLATRRKAHAKAKQHYTAVLELAQAQAASSQGSSSAAAALKRWTTYEMRACHGLGHTCRLLKKLDEARPWFEKQHQLAKLVHDQVGQSQALCNLGMIQLAQQDHEEAWSLFDENLKLANSSQLLKAYAHSYMGSVYQSMGHPKESREHYEISLQLFKELGYCHAQQKAIDNNLTSLGQRQRRENCTPANEVNSSPTLPSGQTRPNLQSGSAAHHKKVMLAS